MATKLQESAKELPPSEGMGIGNTGPVKNDDDENGLDCALCCREERERREGGVQG